MLKPLLAILTLLLFSGCLGQKPTPVLEKFNTTKNFKTKAKPEYKPKKQNWITKALYKQYKKWYHTPYKYGGTNSNGIDCSALVQTVYMDAFGISLPRTTINQVKKGYRVKRNSTKEGDIIFFKTGYNTRHAGIIIENDKFMHTSSKYGVKISSFNNPYWKSKYWQSRRILPH